MRVSRTLLSLAALATLPAVLAAQTYPSATDPRNNLKPGRLDAGTAASNMRLVSFSEKPAQFDTARGLTFINSDLAFRDRYVYQGNFAGFTIWDVGNPEKPEILSVVSCITSQGDPSIIGNLLFISAEGAGNRTDCAKGGVQDPKDHMAGVRIYDVSNPRAPRLVKNVQTCKGSHTHTVVPSPRDKGVVYIYVSGNQGARPDSELAGCREGTDPTRRIQLAVPSRRDQGAPGESGEGRGGDGGADLHRPLRCSACGEPSGAWRPCRCGG